MNIESEIFKKYIPNNNKLIKYGFKKSNNSYKYSKTFMNNTFRADILIDNKGQIIGKVIEIELDGSKIYKVKTVNRAGAF